VQRIPFNRPFLAGKEFEYIQQAIDQMDLSGDGHITKECHHLLKQVLGVPKVLLTTSCTHALEMAALLLELKPGDEVIVPSFTFVSTANAFVLRGARPVFADVRPDTLNLDERQLESLITERTKAVVPVHYAGVGCEMNAILAITEPRGIAVVEDNAHGLFGKYRERYLGTFGCLGTQSFHETKNFTCGEGGALIVNDKRFVERAEIIREKGTNRTSFYRGEVEKYTWCDIGSSYLPSGILAAFLFAQLEAREAIQGRRRQLWETYWEGLSDWAKQYGVQMPFIPEHCDQAYHMFYILMPSNRDRTRLIQHLGAEEISAVFHYLPLNMSPMGQKFGGKQGACPVTEDVSTRLVRLPFYNGLSEGDQRRVISTIRRYRPQDERPTA
jgi:dTDP-4-amino-4,6-dideoxygalactose transaminase